MIAASISAVSLTALAGPHNGHGHSHGPSVKVSKSKVEKVASAQVLNLIGKSKIDKSWKDKKISSSEIKEYNGRKEWVVTFKNKDEKDKSKATLYVFVSLKGELIASNFTGK
jgi:hypothetical protein